MAVAVEHDGVFGCHSFLPCVIARSAPGPRCAGPEDKLGDEAISMRRVSITTRCFASLAMTVLYLISRDRGLRAQRGAHFLLGRPPVRALDLGDSLSDDVGRGLHLVE